MLTHSVVWHEGGAAACISSRCVELVCSLGEMLPKSEPIEAGFRTSHEFIIAHSGDRL